MFVKSLYEKDVKVFYDGEGCHAKRCCRRRWDRWVGVAFSGG
jgi:hypothetical protein